jgi:hypothetical protein
MKFLTHSLLFFLLLCCSVTVSAQDYSSFKESEWSDLSFESRFMMHQAELEVLDNYFKNEAPIQRDITQIYGIEMLSIIDDAVEQSEYLEDNNIACGEMRLAPAVVSTLSVSELSEYTARLQYMTDNFSPTDEDFETAVLELIALQGVSSYDLSKSLSQLMIYLQLAKSTKYTKLEMFRDFTGFCDPVTYITDYRCPLGFNGCINGLKSQESIKWLREHSECSNSSASTQTGENKSNPGWNEKSMISEEDNYVSSVYPNPVFNNSKVNFEVVSNNSAITSIEVISIRGNRIKLDTRVSLKEGTNFITVTIPENLNSGVYYFKVGDKNLTYGVVQVVIRK